MKTGQAGLPRKAIQVEGITKVFADIDLGCYNLFIYVRSDGHRKIKIALNKFNYCLSNCCEILIGILLGADQLQFSIFTVARNSK
jgi:hypothetical protein